MATSQWCPSPPLDKTLYETLILSLLDPQERIVQQLNDFQPHRLYGYSSSVSVWLPGYSRQTPIQPDRVSVSRDRLFESMGRKSGGLARSDTCHVWFIRIEIIAIKEEWS